MALTAVEPNMARRRFVRRSGSDNLDVFYYCCIMLLYNSVQPEKSSSKGTLTNPLLCPDMNTEASLHPISYASCEITDNTTNFYPEARDTLKRVGNSPS